MMMEMISIRSRGGMNALCDRCRHRPDLDMQALLEAQSHCANSISARRGLAIYEPDFCRLS